MADAILGVDEPTTIDVKLDGESLTVGANTVFRERVQLAGVLAAQLGSTRPDLRVLFVSGYTDDAVLRAGGMQASRAFLPKQFTPAGLVQKVREVLDH